MNMRHLAVAGLLAATATAAQQPFQLNTGFRTQFQQIAIGDVLERPDGKIIVSGRFVAPGSDPTSWSGGALLQADGSWIPGPTPPPWIDNWFYLLEGKIAPWGEDSFYVSIGQSVVRYNLDGMRDSLYPVQDPKINGGQAGDFHVFPDGRLLLAGNYWLKDTVRGFVGWQYGLVWLNADGSLDTTRTPRSIGGTGALYRIKQLPDGKFLCGGGSGFFEGTQVSTLFRVNSDGALDTGFSAPSTNWGEYDCFLPQTGGKVIVSGRWQFTNGQNRSLVRLLPNGDLDSTFNYNLDFGTSYTTLPDVALVTHVEPIGTSMFAVTGYFDRINGEVHGGIAMIDTAGNLLPGYFEGAGCGAYQYWDPSIVPYPQKVILGIKPAQDGGYFIYGSYHGYDDGTTNDASQRLMSKLYGLNVGIAEQQTSPVQALQIAPNPSAGSTVLSTGAAMANAELVVHDASGRVVWQVAWPAGEQRYTLPAGTLAPGAYVLRVASGLRGPQPPQSQGTSATVAGAPVYTGRLVVMP